METRPGQYARQLARRSRKWATFLFVGFLVLDAFVFLFALGASKYANGSLLALTFALALWVFYEKLSARFTYHFNRARKADAGSDAEEEVASILAGMAPDDFFAVSDIAFPGGNIDHVVICRSGALFAIETKSCKGRVDRRGDALVLNDAPLDRDPVEQASREARWVKDTIARALGIKAYVRAVLLFTQAFVNVRGSVRGVEVSSLRYLKRVLTVLPVAALQRDALWNNRHAIAAALTGARTQSDQTAA